MIGGTTTNFFDKAWHQTIGRNSDQQTQSRAWLTTLFQNRHQLAQNRTSRGSKMNIRRSASATLQQNQNGILRKQQNGIVRKTTDAGVVNGNLYRHNNCNGYRKRETEEIVSHIASEEDSANIDLIHSLLWLSTQLCRQGIKNALSCLHIKYITGTDIHNSKSNVVSSSFKLNT